MNEVEMRSSRYGWAAGPVLALLLLGASAGCARHPLPQPTLASTTGPEASRLITAATLAFEGVTLIDVTDGKLIPEQNVVIAGSRVQFIGDAGDVRVPQGVPVIDGRGKYLIPGLWDMHVHLDRYPGGGPAFYRRLLAYDITGIREAGSEIPLDTLLQWRREIAAGTRAGPRQVVAGPSLKGRRRAPATPDEARHVVDSLKAAGADFIKMRAIPKDIYFAVAAQARKVGLPVGGHLPHLPPAATPIEASDSGATIVDHPYGMEACMGRSPSVEACTLMAERFRRNGTWIVPTILYHNRKQVSKSLAQWLHLETMQRAGMPILAGTDVAGNPRANIPAGSSLHSELLLFVRAGLTPLETLQAATLNPAKALQSTDSLGTIAPGKLADLVLLNANPLVDISNTTKIQAVVANGRYFGRAALDTLLAEVGEAVVQTP